MKLKYFIVKEEVQKQVVSIKCISTKVMIANLLTKRLSPKTFNDHVKHMGISGYHYWNQYYVIWHFELIYLLFLILSHDYILMIISIYVNELCKSNSISSLIKTLVVRPLLIIFIIDHVNRRTISVIHGREYVNAMIYDCHDFLVVSLTWHNMLWNLILHIMSMNVYGK